MLAVVVVAAVEFWPFSARRSAPVAGIPLPAAAAHGRIVVATPDGRLALADPDGGNYTPLHVRGLVPFGQMPVMLAPDGRYLTTLAQVIGISNGTLTAARDTAVDANMVVPALPGAFADHDRAVVALSGFYGYGSADNPIVVYDLASGAKTTLGAGDNVAGDPAAVGVFTTVAAAVQPSSNVPNPSLHPDARVELRDAGHRPVVLATASSLSRVLGLDPSIQAQLVPYPDPAGDKVAVEVDPFTGSPTGGVVVLSRSGRVLGSVLPAFGPVIGGRVTWSPTGRSLAFPNTSIGGPELITWAVGAQPVSNPFPGASYGFGQCLWSPDESAILCPAFGQNAQPSSGSEVQPQKWVIASAAGGPMAMVAARGAPLAWIRSAAAR